MIRYVRRHATKSLGFAQVTLGVLAGSTEIIPTGHLKYYVMALGLCTAWLGFLNSGKAPKADVRP